MTKLAGKVALITGGTSGIGFATARRFIAEGAYVYITGRRQNELDAAVSKLGPHVTGIQGDVSNLADLDRLYEVIRLQHGHLDVLFANAGGGEFVSLADISEEHYNKTFDIKVKGILFTVQKALPLLGEGGSIILTSSISGVKGMPGFSVYGAANAAIRSFVRSWIIDLQDRKLRVNAISPGPTDTEGWRALTKTEEEYRQFKEQSAAAVPLGRVADPDEIAKAVLFLASDDSSFVNGIELFVDGGMAQI